MTDTNDTSEPTVEEEVDPNEPYVRPVDPDEITSFIKGVHWNNPDLDTGEEVPLYPFDLKTKDYEALVVTAEGQLSEEAYTLLSGGPSFGPDNNWLVTTDNGHELQVWDWYYGADDEDGNPQLMTNGRLLCGPHTWIDGVLQPHE